VLNDLLARTDHQGIDVVSPQERILLFGARSREDHGESYQYGYR